MKEEKLGNAICKRAVDRSEFVWEEKTIKMINELQKMGLSDNLSNPQTCSVLTHLALLSSRSSRNRGSHIWCLLISIKWRTWIFPPQAQYILFLEGAMEQWDTHSYFTIYSDSREASSPHAISSITDKMKIIINT